MAPTDPPPALTELDELRGVLARLKLVLDETVNPPDALTTTELTPQLRAAWPEILAAFNQVDSALASGNFTPQLEKVGLTGPSWQLKLSGFKRAFSRLWRTGKEGLRKATGSLLRWSNIILGSLSSVVPAAEIIKEFKESVENDLAEHPETSPPAQHGEST